MRYLPPVLFSLLLCGCGSSTTDQATGSSAIPNSSALVITTANAAELALAADHLFVPTGRNSVETAQGSLSGLEVDGVAAALVELPLAYPILLRGQPGQFPGPGGGTVTSTHGGSSLVLTFNEFVTGDGALLNGTVTMSGAVQGGSGQIGVDFAQFQTSEPDGRFQVDGQVTLNLVRTEQGGTVRQDVERTQNVTVTDLANRGTVKIVDGDSEADVLISNGIENGTGTNRGSLVFSNYRGLNGRVRLAPDLPFAFTIVQATHTSTITSGRSFLEGDGTLRRQVIGPNQIETAVRPAGNADFQFVGVNLQNP